MQTVTDPGPSERPLWQRLLWMAAIWDASVAALGIVAPLLRAAMKQ